MTTSERLLLASRPVLLAVQRMPRWLLTGALVVLVLLGLFGPRWPAVAALAVLVVLLGWVLALLGLDNSRFPAPLRLLAFAGLLLVLVLRATGHG
jgi:hypothetical protein